MLLLIHSYVYAIYSVNRLVFLPSGEVVAVAGDILSLHAAAGLDKVLTAGVNVIGAVALLSVLLAISAMYM